MDRMLFLLGVMQARANQKNPLDAPSMISRRQPASLCFLGELAVLLAWLLIVALLAEE